LKTIEIHEKYGVPVDIYVDDPIFQKYMEDYPGVVEKLKTSPVVVVSYHIRPPMPAYYQFDIFDLDSKSEDELYAFLKPYEENRTNLSTALVDPAPGGYQYVKDTIGYAPVAISFIMDTPEEKMVMGRIYKEKGALLGVTHDNSRTSFGENLYGILARPEDIPIKWYEKAADHKFDGLTAEGYLTSLIEEHGDSGGLFINIKMHENDYYGTSTTFDPVYWNQSERGNPANVPFDISAGYTKFKTTQAMTNEWEWYESAVVYVAEHPELYIAIDNNDVVEMYREAGMLE
jgi:hypothetical protein